MLEMTLKGGDELAAAFRRLDGEARGDALRKAVLPRAEATADLARSKATGHTATSIRVETAEQDSEHIMLLIGTNVFHAPWEEFGIRPHVLYSSRRPTDAIHPGITRRPFLRPAMDERAELNVYQIGVALGDAMERIGR